jgi:TolB protein
LHRHLLYILVAVACWRKRRRHLGEIRQLTNGGENAEAYWAPDGRRIIFQSTRDKLQCDQIFIMNRDGSNQHMVSTGKGRTTCGYFLPDNKHILVCVDA